MTSYDIPAPDYKVPKSPSKDCLIKVNGYIYGWNYDAKGWSHVLNNGAKAVYAKSWAELYWAARTTIQVISKDK
jgi:hypothetical protein